MTTIAGYIPHGTNEPKYVVAVKGAPEVLKSMVSWMSQWIFDKMKGFSLFIVNIVPCNHFTNRKYNKVFFWVSLFCVLVCDFNMITVCVGAGWLRADVHEADETGRESARTRTAPCWIVDAPGERDADVLYYLEKKRHIWYAVRFRLQALLMFRVIEIIPTLILLFAGDSWFEARALGEGARVRRIRRDLLPTQTGYEDHDQGDYRFIPSGTWIRPSVTNSLPPGSEKSRLLFEERAGNLENQSVDQN